MKTKAVIYMHAHTGKPNPLAAINAQEKELRIYCKENKIDIVAVFRDITTGRSRERTGLARACSNVRIGYEKPDLILMTKQEIYSKRDDHVVNFKLFLANERKVELRFISGKNILLPFVKKRRTAILYYFVPLVIIDHISYLKPQHTQFRSWCALHSIKAIHEVVDWSSNRVEAKESFHQMTHQISAGKLKADVVVMYRQQSYSFDQDEYNWMVYCLGTKHNIEVVSFGTPASRIKFGSLKVEYK